MYDPQVNDYVKWNHPTNSDEGWVYFKCQDYITIEVGTKEKLDSLVQFHKKTHTLVVCYSQYWNELQFIKKRETANDI